MGLLGIMVLPTTRPPNAGKFHREPRPRRKRALGEWGAPSNDAVNVSDRPRCTKRKKKIQSPEQVKFKSPWDDENEVNERLYLQDLTILIENEDSNSISCCSKVSLDLKETEASNIKQFSLVSPNVWHKTNLNKNRIPPSKQSKRAYNKLELNTNYPHNKINAMEKINTAEIDSMKNQTKPSDLSADTNEGIKLNKPATVQQKKRQIRTTSIEKSVSCSNLGMTSKAVQEGSLTEINNTSTVFFNEKGWPVKVMRLTNDSPPKALKPWQSRSVVNTSVSNSARKEKSMYTNTKSNHTKAPQTKLLKEEKENTKNAGCSLRKPALTERNTTKLSSEEKRPNENESVQKESVQSELKSMLDNLGETMSKLSEVKDKDEILTAADDVKEPKTATSKTKIEMPRKKSNEKKVLLNKGRETTPKSMVKDKKYDSKEVKAYIQAKRFERKNQMSAELKKKQELSEMHRINLEKLREKASQVLKKTKPTKSAEELKPKWHGPLEDASETAISAIHIFESKIPSSKPKLSFKPKGSETSVKLTKPEAKEPLTLENNIVELIKVDAKETLTNNVTLQISNETLEKRPPTVENAFQTLNKSVVTEPFTDKHPTENSTNLINKDAISHLQLSSNFKNKTNMEKQRGKSVTNMRVNKKKKTEEDENLLRALELAAAEHGAEQLTSSMDIIRKNVEILARSPKFQNGWKLYQLTDRVSESESAKSPEKPKPTTSGAPRGTFDIPHPSFDVPPSPNNLHKRQQTSLLRSPTKKVCMNEITSAPQDNVMDPMSLESALKRVQEEVLQSEKEGKEPDWIHNLKPDPFSMMNMIKLKSLMNKKESLAKKDRLRRKIFSSRSSLDARSSVDDDTDAPSIISMEEDFQILPEPLKLSDIQIPVATSSTRSEILNSTRTSESNSKTLKSRLDESTKSFAGEAPPLEVPKMKLQTSRTHSDLSNSLSLHFPQQPLTSSLSLTSVDNRRRLISESDSSVMEKTPRRKKSSSREKHKKTSEQTSSLESGQIQIGKVLSSAALLLQFHAELNRLDAFDQSLAQVIAAERLYQSPAPYHVLAHTPTDVSHHATLSSPTRDVSQPVSEVRSARTDGSPIPSDREQPVLEHLATAAPSSLTSVQEVSPSQGSRTSAGEPQRDLSPVSSSLCAPMVPASFKRTSKNIEVLQVLIDDAKFNRKQYQLFYKTQEDIIYANYQGALTENYISFRRATGLSEEEIKVREKNARDKLKENWEAAKANVRKIRDKVLSNYTRRIEDLTCQQALIKKQIIYHNSQFRSTEASPKKQTPHRSTSLTSVLESSSSESNLGLQPNRAEAGKEDRLKLEKEISRRLKDEIKKLEEKENSDRLLKTGRHNSSPNMKNNIEKGRRDKSTSPLDGMLKTPTRDVACSVRDESLSQHSHQVSSLQSVEEVVRGSDVYNSESFESPESSETPRQPRLSGFNRPTLANKPFVTPRSKVQIKVPLSPRPTPRMRQRARCSSGSDESLLFSHNETQSEQSDYEVKISALKEQRRQRYAEAKRLQRELKRVQKEQLKATEAALLKQIEVYEKYIQQTKKELEDITSTVIVRPQIKVPRLSDRFVPRTSDISRRSSVVEDISTLQEPPDADETETNSLKSVSEEASSIETTIQSKSRTQLQDSSPEIKEESDRKVESELSEIPSSVVTETSLASESIKSSSTDDPDKQNSVIESTSSHSADIDVKDESQWVDAEKFFDELGVPDEILLAKSPVRGTRFGDAIIRHKGSINSESSGSQIVTKLSEKTVEADQTDDNEKKSEPSTIVSIEALSSDKSENIKQSSKQESIKEDVISQSNEEIESSNQMDVGSVVSIISQAPSGKSQKSNKSIHSVESLKSLDFDDKSKSENDSQSIHSVSEEMSGVEDRKSDISANGNENEPNESLDTSRKSTVSEATFLNHSESNDGSESSKEHFSEQSLQEEEKVSGISNQSSQISDNMELSQQEVIQIFLSDKKDVSSGAEESIDKSGDKLNQTYIIPNQSLNESEDKLDRTYTLGNKSMNESGEKLVKTMTDPNHNEKINNLESIVEEDKTASNVDTVTDQIMNKLLRECVVHKPKKKDTLEEGYQYDEFDLTNKLDNSRREFLVDDFTKRVLTNFLKDATECIVRIHESKKKCAEHNDKLNNGETNALSVNTLTNQLLDALALESSTPTDKGQGDGVSPKSKSGGLNPSSEVELSDGGEGEVFWFDEDLRPVSLQTQREAEELRLKQLQIEQEIKQLEQAQESIPSYYYVREIPNKPPPPYTPPGQSAQPKEPSEPLVMGPTEVERLVTTATKNLYTTWRREGKVSNVQSSEEFTSKPSAGKKFLFDLVKQIFVEITSSDNEEKDIPPWEKIGCRTRRLVPHRTEESLRSVILKKVRVLFGFEPNAIKENLIIQWSRKKRDRVDELLVRESQEEEREWTDYSKCEVAVKNNVALGLFSNLVEETAQVLSSAYQKKLNYCKLTSQSD